MATKTEIEIPEWFKIGIKFNSKWINNGKNECTLLSFNKSTNLAEVHIEMGETNWTEDNWDLQHTIWGFENRDAYTLIEK